MNTSNKPELAQINAGDSFKVLQITAKAGMSMPTHHSTKEAVIIVQEGMATLFIHNKEYKLEKDGNFIIPANEIHSLSINTDFQAIAVMALESKIEFGR